MTAPILYEHFRPGAPMGEVVHAFDATLSDAWQRIYGRAGAGGPAEGAGIAVAMMMRAFLTVVAPRPPGNIHARQQLALESLPQPGESIRTTVTCVSKEIRRERRYVDLDVRGTGPDGRPIYRGLLSIVWAA